MVLFAPVMVDFVKILVQVRENTIGNRSGQIVVIRARAGGSREILHPLQSETALLRNRNLIVWKLRPDRASWIVDRSTQVGKIAGALLQGRDRNDRAHRAAHAAQVFLVMEEIGFMFRTPDERYKRKLDGAADKTSKLVF